MNATENPRKPRRLRLGLRGLMALVLVFGLGLGWFENRASVQREAVARLRQDGVTVIYDLDQITYPWLKARVDWLVRSGGIDRFGTVVGLRYSHVLLDVHMEIVGQLAWLEELDLGFQSFLTDADLTGLGRLTRLKSLRIVLGRSKVTPAIFKQLGSLTRLETVELSGLDAADADLGSLSGLTRLVELKLSGRGITDAGLDRLDGMTGLASLSLVGSSITDLGLAHLVRFGKLRQLNLGGSRITTLGPVAGLAGMTDLGLRGCPVDDAGLSPLAGFRGLQTLDLGGTKITDVGLGRIAGLGGLKILNLSRTKITDAGLGHVAGLAGIGYLGIEDTSVGDAGMAELAKLPGLRYLWMSRTEAADAGLLVMAKRGTARTMLIDTIRITPAGVDAARLARPGLKLDLGPQTRLVTWLGMIP